MGITSFRYFLLYLIFEQNGILFENEAMFCQKSCGLRQQAVSTDTVDFLMMMTSLRFLSG